MNAVAVDADSYRRLLGTLGQWFVEGSRAAGAGVVPCRGGCSACCHGPFDVSVADAELIGLAVRRLPEDERAAVVGRAGALLEKMRALEPGWSSPYAVDALGEERFDRLTDALAAEPCPLLDEAGRCRIYEDRPLVCRMIGLGMRAPGGRVIENACPIQYRFPHYASLEPVAFELGAFEEVEAECLTSAALRTFGDVEQAGYETTIAAVVVERGVDRVESGTCGEETAGSEGQGGGTVRHLSPTCSPSPTRRTAPRSPGTSTDSPAPT